MAAPQPPSVPPAVDVAGLRGGGVAWYCATLTGERPLCILVADEQQVAETAQDLSFFTKAEVFAYPAHEIPPYGALAPDPRTSAQRISALYHIRDQGVAPVIVTSVEAALRRVIPVSQLQRHAELVVAGEELDLDRFRGALVAMAYEPSALVRMVGDFVVRGGIIDLYPPPFITADGSCHDGPLRIDLFGETVESIRGFDPLSQRSTTHLDEAVILPVSELHLAAGERTHLDRIVQRFHHLGEHYGWDAPATTAMVERIKQGRRFTGMECFLPIFNRDDEPCPTIFDHLPPSTRVIVREPTAVNQGIDLLWERIEHNFASLIQAAQPALPPPELFITKALFNELIGGFERHRIGDFISADTADHRFFMHSHALLRQQISRRHRRQSVLAPLTEQIDQWLGNNETVIICCRSEKRRNTLRELLAEAPFTCLRHEGILDLDTINPHPDHAEIFLAAAPISRGFSFPARRLHLLSELELFGQHRLGGRSRKKEAVQPLRFAEVNDGDIVVHRDHGLGIFRGIHTITLQSSTSDFILIEYRDGDKLYVPVDRLTLVTRYEGPTDKLPRIDKLGSTGWQVAKAKVSEQMWKIAQELLDLYARREIRGGTPFSSPGELYRDLEESFAFDETPGQQQAITETVDDLTATRCMDRLICGDVGYGKTEVAIRAAFKVVEDGFQAAVLVPTTVLAEQHLKTFTERLADFPVRVAGINRFKSRTEQKQIISDLAGGAIDIIIGTHRLLSKDISFRKLGLLIIDEEHRFGVSHKEKIKRIKAGVDVLALTATPIPRTLQLSLLGIRDLSLIATPPAQRLPVKTFVARYEELIIKEAITREIGRGGQVFVVHNRVRSISQMASTVQKLVPQARLAVAHGQMAGSELEEIMVDFVRGSIDVLISTTIIESGLDIPSANTIIINRADQLGLAEIYQLRGRVGRSSTQSYAYLLVPSLEHLAKDARDRLRALLEYSELGGGFKLAMSDLQIRGGGNLLGVSQSGHIAAVGYELYFELLQKTIADLKAGNSGENGEVPAPDIDPEVNLRISGFIPEEYIADTSQRYMMYRRVAALADETQEEMDVLREELRDRYGTIPDELDNLLLIIAIKRSIKPLAITKLEQGDGVLVFSFAPDPPIPADSWPDYLIRSGHRLTPDHRLIVKTRAASPAELNSFVAHITTELSALAHLTQTDETRHETIV
jgi:transcription-repair coupling factor (superfamily II helicase)